MSKLTSTADLENLRQTLLKKRDPDQPCITICAGTGCQAYGCDKVTDAFKQEIKKKKLGRKVAIRTTGCHGFCERGPLVVIYPKKIFYQRVAVEDVSEVISETIIKGNLVERLLYVDALAKVLNGISPEEVIETIKKANLRGRGGGGFPAGVKWESCREAEGDVRYVICNADEGDPGAYMDRSLLEGNPHSVLEGMIIGAYAIGSNQGYVYVRNEYPLAISNLTVALKQAERYGLLGDNILGSGFSFGVKIARGGGAFVCGESSALTASLEGNVGEPRAKHIHTVESGLWDKPTNLNNVETWANVPLIIDKGADWYGKIGTEGSKGTKIFSLVGKVNNTGLVEVPMGITLREIIYDIGGGIPGGRKFKAVQTGGPSGGCIPDEHLDLPVDFDRLSEVGSMMGSGGMIVMDERTCMVDIAKYFLNFLKDESCGKCTSCREGVERMHEIITNITLGKGKESDIELLEELGEVIAETSLCALGGTASNPVLSTIRYFRDEYEAHIKDKKCPAGVCKELTRFVIDKEQCVGCGRCKVVCPSQAITGKKKKLHKITQKKCVKCGACFENCKFDAVRIA
jgi:NADH-quinone oxidoreductase subunit F